MERTRIEYSEKTAKFMSKETRNRSIVADFNQLVVVKRVFPNLMDVYDLLAKVYGLHRTTIVNIIRGEAELRRVMSRAAAL